jgi:hypothetical protein
MARSKSVKPTIARRPMPPRELGSTVDFAPAVGVWDWIQENILARDGALHNVDHAHLIDADVCVLWADGGFISKMRQVIGTAEEVAFRCNAWQRGRQEQQMGQWFGRVPSFLITLDGRFASQCTDTQWCALVEHELYHLAHKCDPFGAPMFGKDGKPKIAIQGHDVEEFVGVVRRYGVGDPDSSVARMVKAANAKPEVTESMLVGACGTCLARVA